MLKIRDHLAPPFFEDEEERRVAGLLNTILLAAMATAVTAGIALLFMLPGTLYLSVVLASMFLVEVISLFLMRRGQVRLAGGLFTLALWVVGTTVVFVSGGVRSLGVCVYFVVILIAGLLLGGLAGVGFAGLSFLAISAALYLELRDALPPSLLTVTPTAAWVLLNSLLALAAVLLLLAFRSINEALERAQRNERAWAEANQGLQREIAERKRAELESRRRAAQAALVYEVGQRVSGKLELEALFSEIVTAVRDAFDYYSVILMLLDEETGQLTLQSVVGGYAHLFPKGFSLTVGEGMMGRAVATSEPQVSGDVSTNLYYVRKVGEETKSELVVPIMSGSKAIGVLDLQSDELDAFDQADLMVMETLADQVAVAIENARLYEEVEQELAERELLLDALQRLNTQLQAAAEVSKAVGTILDPEELIDRVVRLTRERFNLYYAGLFLVDEAGEYAVLRAGTGEAGRQMVEAGHRVEVGGRSMTGQCTARAEARIAPDVSREAMRLHNPSLPQTRSEVVLPLVTHGQWCIGALTAQSAELDAFSREGIVALQTIADHLAIAVENARLYDQIRRHASDLEGRVAERTAELTAVNKELEAFAYSVSHDLRAPLRTLDGFSQALLEDYADRLDADGRDYCVRLRAASQRMGQLIDDLLQLSRLTRAEMRREAVDLSAVARAIAAEMRQRDPERQVDVVVADDAVAKGDARLLRVVLENLVGNAWKFTSKHPQARIEFGVTRRDGEQVYYVRDDGAGFDMTYADKLFGAFQRLHSASEFGGTGIGLATVQRVVHRHGGRVWAEGAVGQGATFYFTLSAEGDDAKQ
jgi:signal transduction histidine kinase